MTPYDYQVNGAIDALKILQKYAIVYLAYEERCGKTLTSILVCENSKASRILVITKKKALDGWHETLSKFKHLKKYTVTNFHQAGKFKADNYDLVIIDEAHSYISAYPKPGTIWREVRMVTKNKPIIYLSATPYAQGPQLLFNQFKLSSWTPFPHKNFYDFFREYGIPSMVRTAYGLQETYSKVNDLVLEKCSHLFLTNTRKELDFDHEPEDIIHFFELSQTTKDLYNGCLKNEMLRFKRDGKVIESPLDSSMKLRTTLHMLEGGVAKVGDKYYILSVQEKIDCIVKEFGDSSNTVIMYQYIAEGDKLKLFFKNVTLLQGTSFAEGVDLSMFDNLIIYSQDFSTARHSQRRARQANKNRSTPIKVHFYLVKGGISEQVYKTVSINKTNFIDKLFKKVTL